MAEGFENPELTQEEKAARIKEREERGRRRVLEDARSTALSVRMDGELKYLQSTSGLLRIGRNRETGRLFVCGHNGKADLLELANMIANDQDDIDVDKW